MIQAVGRTASFQRSATPAHSLRLLASVRLLLGLSALLGAIMFLEGASWDIQWHTFIGRDRTLIPPHIVLLSGVTLSGAAGLLSAFIESWWARRNPTVAQHTTHFATVFAAPLGAYIVGYAALTAAIAFPLDAYWHALYGIDVAIWAPFHIMFIASMGVVALGAAYVLISAAHLATSLGEAGRTLRRAATAGAVLALATMFGLFTLMLFDSIDGSNTLNLGFTHLSVFPLLSGLLVAFTLVAAAYALPWRWAATSVAGCYLSLAVLMALFVQPATAWLLSVEQLHYRQKSPPPTSIVALEWFLMPLLSALLIDVIMHRARRQQWSQRKVTVLLALAALLSGALPILPLAPELPIRLFVAFGIGFPISVLIGLAGAFLGTFFGRNVGATMRVLER